MDLLSLPSEIIYTILTYLPIQNLLLLARTNKELYHLALSAITQLHLIAVPKPLHTTLTKLDLDTSIYSPDHLINLNLTPDLALAGLSSTPSSRASSPSLSHNPQIARHELLSNLNALLTDVLTASSLQHSTLHTLTIQTWSPTPALLTLLSNSPHLSHLHHLTLNFSHPTHRHPCLPSHYWTHPDPASALWNSLTGLGEIHSRTLRLRSLETLRLHRAGLTSAQLRSWVAMNPGLRALYLYNVRGVDEGYLEFLARRATGVTRSSRRQLEILEMVDCAGLDTGGGGSSSHDTPTMSSDDDTDDTDPHSHLQFPKCQRIYASLQTLVRHGLNSLTVKRCPGVDPRRLQRMNTRNWHLRKLELDDECRHPLAVAGDLKDRVLEVDDDEIDEVARSMEEWRVSGAGWSGRAKREEG